MDLKCILQKEYTLYLQLNALYNTRLVYMLSIFKYT